MVVLCRDAKRGSRLPLTLRPDVVSGFYLDKKLSPPYLFDNFPGKDII